MLKVKGAAELKRWVVLCAYGITHDGVREFIDFRQASQAPSESEAMWTAFLDSLYRRGLTGDNLDLVSTDECTALHRAIETSPPERKN